MDQNSWGEKGGALIQGDTIIIIAKIARGNAYSGVYKGQTNSKYFFQANVSCKKQTNKFDFTTVAAHLRAAAINLKSVFFTRKFT